MDLQLLPAESVDINLGRHVLLISHEHPSLMWAQHRADPPELFISFHIFERLMGGGRWGGGVRGVFNIQISLYVYARPCSVECEFAQMLMLRVSFRLLNLNRWPVAAKRRLKPNIGDEILSTKYILFYFVNETCSAPGPDSQPFPLLPCRPDDGPLQAKLDQQNQLHHCGPDQTSIRKMRSKASRKMSSFLPQTIILRVVWLYWCVIDDPLVTGWRKKTLCSFV